MSLIVQGGKMLETGYGMLVTKGPQVVPTVSGNLYVVTGSVLITSFFALVTTVFTATVTTLSIGTAAGATTLINAAALTSATVGTWFNSPVGPTAFYNGTNVTQPLPAGPGGITWIASATNTGQLKTYICYVPLEAGASIS